MKVKRKVSMLEHHFIKPYVGVEVKLHALLTVAVVKASGHLTALAT